MIYNILGALTAGLLATTLVAIASIVGGVLNQRVFRQFASLIIAVMAMRIAGYSDIPLLSDFHPFGLNNIDGIDLASLIIFGTGLAAALVIRNHDNGDVSNDDLSIVRKSFIFLIFIMILPSLDGNLFILASKGQLSILDPVAILIIGTTIISGPGSIGIAATIGACLRNFKNNQAPRAITLALLAGGIATLSAVGITLVASLIKAHSLFFSMEVFAPIASVAIFLVALMLKGGDSPLASVPLAIIVAALSTATSQTSVSNGSLIWAILILVSSLYFIWKEMRSWGLVIGLLSLSPLLLPTQGPEVFILVTLLFHGANVAISLPQVWKTIFERLDPHSEGRYRMG